MIKIVMTGDSKTQIYIELEDVKIVEDAEFYYVPSWGHSCLVLKEVSVKTNKSIKVISFPLFNIKRFELGV